MIGKFIRLPITKLEICFCFGLTSHFMHKPREINWKATIRILIYISSSPEKGLLPKKYGHISIFAYLDARYNGDKGDTTFTMV